MEKDELHDGLTEAEIAALEESDGGASQTLAESMAQTNGETTGDTNVDEGAAKGKEGGEGGDGDAEAAAAGDAAGKAAEAGATDGDAAGAATAGDGGGDGTGTDAAASGADTKPIPDAPFAPLMVAEMPERAQERLAEFKAEKDRLSTLFDDGEITVKEFREKLDAVDTEQRKLERQIEKAETAQELNQQAQINRWMAEVHDFTHRVHAEYSKSQARYRVLDHYVKEVGNDKDFAQASGPEILAEAHKRVMKDLGIEEKAAQTPRVDSTKGEVKGKTGEDLNAAGRPLKGSKAKAPETLRAVPASQANDIDGDAGKWAVLDRLRESDPEAHEERLMRMSADERDRYLAHG